jgi:C-terminal processing protease CtpA/Prc
VTGLKRKFISDNSPSYINGLRVSVSKEGSCATAIKEIETPAGYDGRDWIFYKVTREIEPKDPYNFNGDIYVLVNDRSYSAAEGYAINVKKTGYAKLVGTNTPGGAAAYVRPHFITLPNSGMKFVVEADMVINPDGSIVEIVGTAPDIALNPSNIPDVSTALTRQVLLEDEWIKSILTK